MLYFVQHPARLLRWNYLLILFIYFYHYTRLSWKAKKLRTKAGAFYIICFCSVCV